MNCSVCGGPLLFDRVVFKCSCGAYVHAYCVDKHIIDSHRPEMVEGYADLNGEFHPKFEPAPAPVAEAEIEFAEADAAEQETVVDDEDLVPGEQVMDESGMDEAGTEESDGEDN